MSQEILLEKVAKAMASVQIDRWLPKALALGFTKERLIAFIRMLADFAVEEINRRVT